MKKQFISSIVVGCFLASSNVVLATDTYVSLKFGASVVEDNDVSDSSITTLSDGKYEADFGHAVSGAIGMAFRDGYRLEFEVIFCPAFVWQYHNVLLVQHVERSG